MVFNPFSLTGKTILVTGASSGIGRQCAIDCSRGGAKIVLIGRNEDRLKETLSNLQEGTGIYFIMDLSDTEQIRAGIEQIIQKVGKIDGLIHAAGIEKTTPVKYTKLSDYENVYRTNAISGFEIIRLLASNKVSNDSASFILIASITGIIGRAGVVSYAASKGAMIAAARTMAQEFAGRKIRVNCISPGTILTPMMTEYLESLTEDQKKKRLEGFLLGLGSTEDVSNTCIYLLSDASRWVTGQNLIVDGGYTAV
mgnify:CR=1 FL=1